MTVSSKLRYLAWRGIGVPETLTVKLVSGPRLLLRREPADDLMIAREVFIDEVYRSPRRIDPSLVKRVVDVGANVGYSILYFLREYPQARIDAFEPHPLHCAQLEAHLGVNDDGGRILIHPVAAGVKAGCSKLTDAGVGSQLDPCAATGYSVEVIDLFKWAGSEEIDLLKLDCEGSEYDLVMDERFGALKVSTMVVEWHATDAHPQARRDIFSRLESLGFEVSPVNDYELPLRQFGFRAVGVAWAYRREEADG